MGSVIRSKEKLIVNEEIPKKFFDQAEKQNQIKKQIKILKNEQNKTLKKLIMTFLKNAINITKIYTKNKITVI